MVVETLAEKHFDLAFRMLHEFDLPGTNITFNVCFSYWGFIVDYYFLHVRNIDLVLKMAAKFVPAADIYAGVAASLAGRKKGGQLTEFLKNIRGTIDDDEWDQVIDSM
jgi:zinc finger FYVE domain-containing protein 26